MINIANFNKWLNEYKKEFDLRIENEIYKWKAVKTFQDNWDINAIDFYEMLSKSLSETGNLLTSRNYFPRKMIKLLAKQDANRVRNLFRDLFDESNDVIQRILNFADGIDLMYSDVNWQNNHYQNLTAITTYLWLRYPDKYYIYKTSEVKSALESLGYAQKIISAKKHYSNNLKIFFDVYDEISNMLSEDDEIKTKISSKITNDYYLDPNCKTLAIDFCRFIYVANKKPNQKVKNYWWLVANPKIWKFADSEVGFEQTYSLYTENGHKRHIFENFINTQEGDSIVVYESTPTLKVVGLAKISNDCDDDNIYFEKECDIKNGLTFSEIKNDERLKEMEFLANTQGSLFKLTKEQFDILSLDREEKMINNKYTKSMFLDEVYISEEDYNLLTALLKRKKNIILEGAPGVGKTFAAKRLAYSMMGEKDDSRVKFIQFHQSYSYEDFIEGLRPNENGKFELKDGVFKKFVDEAKKNINKDYFFIIDEINRGNLSKIFGELFMLIEADKRGEGHKFELLYSNDEFYIPENLYIIGLMNTADRSIAMMDYALRRRFGFFGLAPAFDNDKFIDYKNSLNNPKFNSLIDKIIDLNKVVEEDLGSEFKIGHSSLCNHKYMDDSLLNSIVEYEILPLIKEYWFDNTEKSDKWVKELREVIK